MSSNFSNTLDGLRDASSQLNSLSDSLNGFVARIEAYLDECSVGVPVSINAPGGLEVHYCRYGQKFRFVVETGATVSPWSDCPRETKLQAITVLPDLLATLEGAVREKVNAVTSTLHTLSKMYPQLAHEPLTEQGLLANLGAAHRLQKLELSKSEGIIAAAMKSSSKSADNKSGKRKGIINTALGALLAEEIMKKEGK